MYENLSRKIDVDPKSIPSLLEGEFAVFSNTNRTNHPAIIKVLFVDRTRDCRQPRTFTRFRFKFDILNYKMKIKYFSFIYLILIEHSSILKYSFRFKICVVLNIYIQIRNTIKYYQKKLHFYETNLIIY